MALDQSALLEVLKGAGVEDRIRPAAETIYQSFDRGRGRRRLDRVPALPAGRGLAGVQLVISGSHAGLNGCPG